MSGDPLCQMVTRPALIRPKGCAACLQVDFTPLGARAFFGAALAGMAERMRSPGSVAPDHAGLSLDASVIMVGQHRDDAFALIVGAPGPAAGGAVYLAVEGVDALHDRIAASSVRIEQGLTDRPYGSRQFTCRDAEGYVWRFGTYLSGA